MRGVDLSTKLSHLLAAEPALVADPQLLAARIRQEAKVISDVDVLSTMRAVVNNTKGLGRLEPLMGIKNLNDVVVNGPNSVFYDCGNGLERSQVTFSSEEEIRSLATRLVIAAGGRLDDSKPCADGRLQRADGTIIRIHAMLSPPSLAGTLISLRVLRTAQISLETLVSNRSISGDMVQVLRRLIHKRISFLVVGGTGSGKTTILGALLASVNDRERLVIIEDTAELCPPHPHVVSLVQRRANSEGRGEISMAELLKQALRMRPDRIVVGEIRGKEIVDLLSALNTGHEGGAGTLHANSLAEVPARVEALARLGGLDRQAVHSQLCAAVKVVLVVRKLGAAQRELFQIGLLEGNPVVPKVAWDSRQGKTTHWRLLERLIA